MKLKILIISLIFSVFAVQVQAQTETKTFRGFLNGKRIQMTLTRDGGKLSGTYLYTKYRTDLMLDGTIDKNGKFILVESDQKGVKTGEFSGTWKEDANNNGVSLEGDWKKPKSADSIGFIANEQMIDFKNGAKLITKTFSETNKLKRFDMSAEYPEISDIDAQTAAKFNQLVKAEVMKALAEFKKTMTAQTAEDLKYLPKGVNNYIDISYNVELANDKIISLQFGDSEYGGGAHPNYSTSTLNFDLQNGRELKLADLFQPKSNYLKVISDYSIAELKKATGEMSDDNWIKEGAGAKAENFQSWNLTKKGLMFTFDPYQVAAYAAGSFSVIVPYDNLKTYLNPTKTDLFTQK
ncbi:hypothetical protein BH20ACI1_BH20ACI1_01950 [soil metagenome]